MIWRHSKQLTHLSEVHLGNLKEHKYSCHGKSLIEPVFQVYWNWIINYVPTSVAPNTLTLIGLVINVVSVIILSYYSPDGRSSLPSWALLLCAFSLFLYQTLDALDGKQARRTNTSSQLGELFDHGCDAVSSNFVVLGSILSVRIGEYPWFMFIHYFLTICLFYMAHWQVYVTGTLKFGSIDVTETQLAVILVYIISAIFGVEIWDETIPYLNIELKMVHTFVMFIGGFSMFWRYVKIILAGGSGRHGATIANTSILFPFCPIALVIALALTVAIKSQNHIYQLYPCLFLISFGMVACKVTQKLVVAHMTKSELSLFDTELIGPLILIMNQYLFNSYFNEVFILWCCCIYSTCNMLCYARSICIQIADYLNLYIFSVVKMPIATTSNITSKNNFIGAANSIYNSTVNSSFNSSSRPIQPNRYRYSSAEKKKS